MLGYSLVGYIALVYLLRLNLKFHYFPGLGGKIENKANSAQMELELGLSLAIFEEIK
jgi:hypothetical protein